MKQKETQKKKGKQKEKQQVFALVQQSMTEHRKIIIFYQDIK